MVIPFSSTRYYYFKWKLRSSFLRFHLNDRSFSLSPFHPFASTFFLCEQEDVSVQLLSRSDACCLYPINLYVFKVLMSLCTQLWDCVQLKTLQAKMALFNYAHFYDNRTNLSSISKLHFTMSAEFHGIKLKSCKQKAFTQISKNSCRFRIVWKLLLALWNWCNCLLASYLIISIT